jgi:hypothetical protein
MKVIKPVCLSCWKQLHPDTKPVSRGPMIHTEYCSLCGRTTEAGLYIHLEVVKYPQWRHRWSGARS